MTAEQLLFEQNEGAAVRVADSHVENVVVNNSAITFTLQLETDRLLSFVADCGYNLPGSATSFQRSVGLTFADRTADICRCQMS